MEGELLATARSVAEEAGELLLEGLKESRNVSHKSSSSDLVTQYDHASQELIVERIQDSFPTHSILAEEEFGLEKSSTKWVIDPLDGTTNYVHNYPLFGVSVAVESEGEVVVGAVHLPVLEETFTAARGAGATLNGEEISVSDTAELSGSLLSTGFPYDTELFPEALAMFSELAGEVRGIRRDGSAAADLAFVASGRYDGFWEIGLSSWDVAAGSLILEEAGGQVSDLSGEDHQLYRSEGIVATNGEIHEEVLGKLS